MQTIIIDTKYNQCTTSCKIHEVKSVAINKNREKLKNINNKLIKKPYGILFVLSLKKISLRVKCLSYWILSEY